jgi:hypothetical protein
MSATGQSLNFSNEGWYWKTHATNESPDCDVRKSGERMESSIKYAKLESVKNSDFDPWYRLYQPKPIESPMGETTSDIQFFFELMKLAVLHVPARLLLEKITQKNKFGYRLLHYPESVSKRAESLKKDLQSFVEALEESSREINDV